MCNDPPGETIDIRSDGSSWLEILFDEVLLLLLLKLPGLRTWLVRSLEEGLRFLMCNGAGLES